MKNKFMNFLCGAIALGLTAQVEPVAAAEGYYVGSDAVKMIDEHGQCRVTLNKNGLPVRIPTKASGEWHAGTGAFLFRDRAGMVVTDCSKPDVFESCPSASASTPNGRRPLIFVVVQSESYSEREYANPVVNGINDMVDEIQRCGGDVRMTWIQTHWEIVYGDGTRDARYHTDALERNQVISNVGPRTAPSNSYDPRDFGNTRASYYYAVRRAGDYMESYAKSGPNNARYVILYVGEGAQSSMENFEDNYAGRNREQRDQALGSLRDANNAGNSGLIEMYVGTSQANSIANGKASDLGMPTRFATGTERKNIRGALWAVGRNVSLFSQGMISDPRFNDAQKAVFNY